MRDRNPTSPPPHHNTIVILAAGLSTRYGTLKQLEAVGPRGATLLDYSIHDALRAGFTRVVLVVRSEIAAAMDAHTTRWVERGVELSFAFQSITHPQSGVAVERRKPWGTAHAALVAAQHIDGAFAVCNADDFYGRDAFMRLANHLWNGQHHASAIVGYRLADTLSEFGGVSRALCEIDGEGWLERITELKNIAASPHGFVRGQSENDETFVLNGSEVVSTNLWGLTPPVVKNLGTQFEAFMERQGRDRESEFLLSTAINEQLRVDAVRVRVLPTDARFLGITFPEDKPSVVESIAEMIGRGHYPADLWREAP